VCAVSHHQVAAQAMAAGASIVNDVSAGMLDQVGLNCLSTMSVHASSSIWTSSVYILSGTCSWPVYTPLTAWHWAAAVSANVIHSLCVHQDMLSTVAGLCMPYIMMHMRGTPSTMMLKVNTAYQDVVR